jgi:hypothetical protein
VNEIVWFSELHRKPILVDGVEIGKVEDAVLRLEESAYPVLTGFILESEDRLLFLPMDKSSFGGTDRIEAQLTLGQLDTFERRPAEILVGRDLLDHHLIWTRSRIRARLVSVKDVGLLRFDSTVKAIAIDAGGRQGKGWFSRNKGSRHVIDWRETVPLIGHVPTARKRLELKSIRKLHPAQLADLLEQASKSEGQEIMGALQSDPEFEADVVEELDQVHRRETLRNRSDEEVGELLGTMEPDDAVDMLLALDQDRRENVLALIPEPSQERVKRLLAYHPLSAGGIMTTDFVALPETATAGEACALLKSKESLPTNLWTLFLVDGDQRIIGQLPLSQLLVADPLVALRDIAEIDPPKVAPNADIVEVALTMADYNLVTLAVVDEDFRIIGAVTIDDVLPRTLSSSWRRRQEAIDE